MGYSITLLHSDYLDLLTVADSSSLEDPQD
jgi:hypothetical protein